LHVEFPDPARSATGLVALTELRRLCGRGEAARAALAGFAVHVQGEPGPGGAGPLGPLGTRRPAAGPGAAPPPATLPPGQAGAQFERAEPRQPLAARSPAEGGQELSYPYVPTTADPLTLAAASRFGDLLRSAYAASYVRYAGFRSGDGTAGRWPALSGLASN